MTKSVFVIMKETTIINHSIGNPISVFVDKERAQEVTNNMNTSEAFQFYYIEEVDLIE